MRSYPVKESPIGSAISKILRYRQKKLTTLYYTLAVFRGTCEWGSWILYIIFFFILDLKRKTFFFFWGGGVWEGGGNLPENSLKISTEDNLKEDKV